MERLIVKNFGPLKDVDIELNKINLFIGENGSGKSVLGKIVTIVLNSPFKADSKKSILQKFIDYGIGYIQEDTYIKYEIEDIEVFSLEKKKIKILTKQDLVKSVNINQLAHNMIEENNLDKNSHKQVNRMFHKILNQHIEYISSQYIPAERNLISLFNKSLTTLLVAEVPLPKFLLAFSSEFEKAGNELKELELLNIKYVNGDGLDRHKVYFDDENYLPLEFSSSGIQSALPLYLTVKYFANRHSSIIIEEPEQNLFPKAQKETIQYIVEQVSDDNNLFMMTHSPYVLSAINNLIYAHVVASLGEKEKEQVQELIDKNQWINPDDFSAYYLENGVARSIKSDIGLISDNEIDNISEEMGEEFDELLEIYRASKND